jgi:ADP-ribose pyrophosphatase YjhB (NUDIX family)
MPRATPTEDVPSAATVTRSMVRGILLEDAGAVLLMRMAFPWFERPVWIVPGGGLQDGELAAEGLRRELEEETGRGDLRIGSQVWEWRFVVEHEGRVVHAHERYFLVRTERFEPDVRGLEAQERAWFRGFRWWSLQELVDSREDASPDTLASLLMRLVADLDGRATEK